MGIKSDPDAAGSAFSRDILRVEVSGPNEQHLTVIDVPGMFENETPGITTTDDIELVKDMVKKYIQEPRTIILAVVPCNGDIANQKILNYAKDADPEGKRTMGVLTKPDLAVENATKEVVVDLVLGRRRDLKLGYCLVKNRSADDTSSSHEERDRQEKSFFSQSPWTRLPTDRLGIPSLKTRLQRLLMDTTRSELPKVRADLKARVKRKEEDIKGMGQSRATPDQQRMYLGEIAAKFNRIKDQGLDAYYNRSKIFAENPDLKLITKIRDINEHFAEVLYQKGHTRLFDENDDTDSDGVSAEEESSAEDDYGQEDVGCSERDGLYDWKAEFNIPKLGEEDLDNILSEPYNCPEPSEDDILSYIESEHKTSRGIELGTFSGEMLPTTFKEQSKKWAPMARAHVSNAILIVHHFIFTVLERCCPDPTVRDELWTFLLDDLRMRYQRAVDHTEFLLTVEFEGTSMTYNPTFDSQRGCYRRNHTEFLKESG